MLLLLAFSLLSDPACPPAEQHRFDFLVGDWSGREYNFMNGSSDSTPGDRIAAHNRKLPYGCAFEEHWEFTSNDSGWVFAYDIPGPTPRRLHIRWVPTPSGYTEVMQVSPDSGRTWPIVRHLNYTSSRSTNVAQ